MRCRDFGKPRRNLLGPIRVQLIDGLDQGGEKMTVHAKPILGVLPFVLGSILMAQTTINVKDLEADGVILTPSTSANFSAQLTAAIGTPSPAIAPLIPYSVILRNATGRTIRGYALRWTYIDQKGAIADGNYFVDDNFDTRQVGGNEISPGAARVLSPTGVIRPPSTTSFAGSAAAIRPNTLAKLANYAAITVSLDSVAFEDGKVIGPNEGAAMDMWASIYAAARDFGAATLHKNQTSSPSDVINWLKSQATQPEVHPAGASQHEQLASASHWYQIYTKLAAERLLRLNGISHAAILTEASRMAETPVPVLSR